MRIEHRYGGTEQIGDRVAIDPLAHVTEEVDRLQRTIGKETARTGMELTVYQRSDVRIVLVCLNLAFADQLRGDQNLFDRSPNRYAMMFRTNRYGNFFHILMIIIQIISNKRYGLGWPTSERNSNGGTYNDPPN